MIESNPSQRMSGETTDEWCKRQAGYQYEDRYGRENRIEALRAASRIVAGYCANPLVSETEDDYIHGSWTLQISENFAKWLETGER